MLLMSRRESISRFSIIRRMKKLKAPPGARRLIESLRSLGYECSTAVADLIDNSIAAQASEVYVDIYGQNGSRPPHVVIADNGRGFDVMRLATGVTRNFGLQFMRERADLMGSELHVESRQGEGTRILLRLPEPSR